MNRMTVLLVVLSLAAMFLGCTSKPVDMPKPSNDTPAAEKSRPAESPKPKDTTKEGSKTIEAFKPSEAKKGEPVVFKIADHDVKEWKSKSKADSSTSFKVNGENWYIDWDAERKPFDTIIIHHSATSADATADYIEDIHQKMYVKRYQSASKEPFVQGLPVHSGHIIDGKERFIGYHHLVYLDGKVTTELSPLVKIGDKWFIDHVGWHAGDWSVNLRSVAICLVGNFSKKETPEPSGAQLRATASLVAYYRGFNPKLTVKSHGEVANTECPGKTWHLWRGKIVGN